MGALAAYLEEFVRGLGKTTAGIGLFVAAFFDSSLLSLPEVNDLLLIYFGTVFPDHAYYYAAMTVAGSASGASLLYGLARWKGYAYLNRRFPDGQIESVFRVVRRYGALAVAVPSVLPPPFPFKIFVLSSGVLGLPYRRFLAAILIGRSFRYFGEAFLAVRYGNVAILYLRENALTVLLGTMLVAVVACAAVWLIKRRRSAARDGSST